ncbi:MAG: hypothetical protein Q4B45_03190 [Coriobacteriia bacterium]|nr:hypothetical protein [Coriobacteriia bacterium]
MMLSISCFSYAHRRGGSCIAEKAQKSHVNKNYARPPPCVNEHAQSVIYMTQETGAGKRPCPALD